MVKRVHLTDPSKSCSSKGKDLRTHFKNTYEIGRAIKGMMVKKAENYLKEVLEHKKCIPFTKYNGSMGRTTQAQQFGLTKGRWPEKSVRIVLNLLKNAIANAESKKLREENLAIKRVVVNQAVKGRRRTYRAHGRINAYLASNCHVEIFLEEIKPRVKKEKKEEEKISKPRNTKFIIRKALAKAYHNKKFVVASNKK
ncbi:MAG: 50S ribosomal protein L22 [archaeon]|nr:50S ribosomal protein L22 [archaeon]